MQPYTCKGCGKEIDPGFYKKFCNRDCYLKGVNEKWYKDFIQENRNRHKISKNDPVRKKKSVIE